MNKKRETAHNAKTIAELAVRGAQELKALDIAVMDLRQAKSAIADYFVVCTGTSDTHVEAIMQSIDKAIYLGLSEDPWKTEGKANREWILMDYVNVVVHVFQKSRRTFYGLEELWGDAETIRVSNDAQEEFSFA